MTRLLATTNPTRLRLTLALLSLLLSLWHFGPLNGSLAALLLTVGGQVYLLGYLSAWALGLLRESASAAERLAWIVVCGLGISISLGAAARLLLIAPSVYVIGLHGLMLALGFVPATPVPRLRFERKALPYYTLLALACVVFAVVGWERNRLRFDGYEDQTLLVSLTDWWAHHLPPENLVSRNIAETNALTYWSSDGLTYVLASWVWTSGVSAVQLIWYALTPLFAWLVPVAHFALAKKITGRDDTAAWTTAFVLLLALTTADGVIRYSGYWTFGQQAAFQLDTLRTFATALMLPLALFALLASLRAQSLRHALMTGIFALALALTHPRQFLVVIAAFYAILAVWWLVAPSRSRLRTAGLIGLLLIPALLIPLWQYSGLLGERLSASAAATVNAAPSATAAAVSPIILNTVQLPVLGRVIDPAALFYHPLIALALAFGIASAAWLRRSLAAQFIFTTSALLLALAFVQPILDGLIALLNPYYGVRFALGFVLVVPVGLILGIGLAGLHDRIGRRGGTLIAAGLAALALGLLIEPIPLPNSARDQIAAATQMQALRDIQPFDETLLDNLQKLPQTGDRAVYLTSNRLASFVIESVPGAFVTAGRSLENPAYEGSLRFYDAQNAPWLDSADLEFLRKYRVAYIVVTADSTRLPQLALQPERFEQVDAAAGYIVFRVRDVAETDVDRTFADMNALYKREAEASRRWDADGFHLSRGVDAAPWQSLIAGWRALLEANPRNDLIRYGLAFTSLMAGDDQPEVWAALSAAHPDLFAVTNAYAHILREHDQPGAALEVLTAQLDALDETTRVLAARTLLSEPFFYLLTPEALDRIVALADSGSLVWEQLMEWDQADDVRERAALLMSAGRLDEAARWLERIPNIEVSPRDLVTRAAVRLARGDEAGARMLLSSGLDGDTVALRANLHPERWTPAENAAARMTAALDAPLDDLSPRRMAETGEVFAQDAQVEESNSTLIVTATVGNFTPALPVREVTVQVTSPDSQTIYGEATLPVTIDAGGFARAVVSVDLPDDLLPLTPARVVIRAQYSSPVVYATLTAETILNRPTDVRLPDEAQRVDLRFGEHISLVGYTARVDDGTLDLTLYWTTDAALAEDDQVTVQLFDAAGERQTQHDATPDDGRYPTRFWLPNTLIADTHHLTVSAGEYDLIVGMYRLPDLARLSITPTDERVRDNLLRLGRIEVGA